MIRSFRDGGSEDVFYGRQTKAARRACPESVWRVATRKLDQLDSVVNVAELRIPPNNRLEALKGKRKGTWSVRVSGNWRVTFGFEGPDAYDVNYEDYHR